MTFDSIQSSGKEAGEPQDKKLFGVHIRAVVSSAIFVRSDSDGEAETVAHGMCLVRFIPDMSPRKSDAITRSSSLTPIPTTICSSRSNLVAPVMFEEYWPIGSP